MNPSLVSSSTLVYPNDFTPITIQTYATEEPDFSFERVVFFYFFCLRHLRLPFTFPMNPSLLSSTLVYANDFTPITIQTYGTEDVRDRLEKPRPHTSL